jgi:hypothetical protein
MRESEMPDNNDEAVERKGEKDQAPKAAPEGALIDPNDVVPVPVAMEPAEIEERAKTVEALRERQEELPRHRAERPRGRKSVIGDDPDRDESRGRR